MFQGETSITIDEKGRLAIPVAYRDLVARDCGNRLVVTYTPWERGSLWLYPHAEWERVRDEVNRLPMAKPAHRQLQLKLVGAATFVELDGSSRILVPPSHRSASGIDRWAVLLGMGSMFELWSEQAHLEQVQKTIAEHEVSEAMLELVL